MDILDRIIAFKRNEVRIKKNQFPVNILEESLLFKNETASFHKALAKPGASIIGEFKRKSPSKGIINSAADVNDVAKGYEKAGIAAISVLTDMEFFGGDNYDLKVLANVINIPLLRKEFIIDEYQVIESKSIGASAILLIASVLSKNEVQRFGDLAYYLGMDVLLELHDEKDLDKINNNIKIIGVNNRNLKTFEVNIDNSLTLFARLPLNCIKVAESGFQTVNDVIHMVSAGYDAFLIGEKFMRSEDPGKSAADFITDLKIKMK